MKKILILTNSIESHGIYLIDAIALRWKKHGHKIILHQDVKNIPDADIVILHIDRTYIKDDYIRCLSRFPVVLNRNVTDISKTMISNNIIKNNDNYSGSVIVKTNANCGGFPDSTKMSRRYSEWVSKWNWGMTIVHNTENYPVFENKGKVPRAVWKNKNLIVEKFLPERQDGLFYYRYWMFLGEKGWAGRFGAREPVVKFSKMATADEEVSVPEELKIVRKKLGFDYGRFDYVEHHGKTVLFDVNKTVGGAQLLETYSTRLDMLAEEINNF